MAKEQVTFCSLICHKFSHCCQVNLLDRETISVHWKTHQSRTRNASCTQKYLVPQFWSKSVQLPVESRDSTEVDTIIVEPKFLKLQFYMIKLTLLPILPNTCLTDFVSFETILQRVPVKSYNSADNWSLLDKCSGQIVCSVLLPFCSSNILWTNLCYENQN